MDLIAARHVPYMARRNYLIELRHLLAWGVFAGTFEGSVSSVVAAKTFDADWLLITLIMATPMVANLMGLAWGGLATGRRKLPLFQAFAAAATLVIASIALTPATPAGGWIFAAQILLTRIMLSGCMTLRASLWKHNYPHVFRGRIAARLQLVRHTVGIVAVLCISMLFDLDPAIYVWVYPIGAAVGAVAILVIRPMHVRGERLELRQIAERAESRPQTGWTRRLGDMIAILKQDRPYARYCLAMMLLGSSNIMVMPIITVMVTKELRLSYFHSCNITEILPRILMMGSVMLWAGLFDRVGAVRFRVLNGCVWASAGLFGGIGAFVLQTYGIDSPAAFAVVVAGISLCKLVQGLGMGGGVIAWNIGHLHFAEPEKAELYMGLHVTLTGIRGLVFPFFGTALYVAVGWPAFAVALVLAAAGVIVFARLARDERNEARSRSAVSDPLMHASSPTGAPRPTASRSVAARKA